MGGGAVPIFEAEEGACALGGVGGSVLSEGDASGSDVAFETGESGACSFALTDAASDLAHFHSPLPPEGLVRFLLFTLPILWAVSPRSSGRVFGFFAGLTPIWAAVSGHDF